MQASSHAGCPPPPTQWRPSCHTLSDVLLSVAVAPLLLWLQRLTTCAHVARRGSALALKALLGSLLRHGATRFDSCARSVVRLMCSQHSSALALVPRLGSNLALMAQFESALALTASLGSTGVLTFTARLRWALEFKAPLDSAFALSARCLCTQRVGRLGPCAHGVAGLRPIAHAHSLGSASVLAA